MQIQRHSKAKSERGDAERTPKSRETVGEMHHGCAPTRTSFPITTPEAAEIEVAPEASICACAIPRLMGASTELFPFALVAVKVTIVPSGTGLPAQSRTGSVCTEMPTLVR